MIPIIIVAVIAIGAIALISNSESLQNQANETEQTSVSEKTDEPIKEIEDESESAITSALESTQNQPEEIEKSKVSSETLGPSQEIKETKPEPTSASKIESNQSTSQLKAVIIDQLHDQLPNYDFQSNATRMLQDAGYQVDLYTTKDITVEFYKNLPSMNYNFILVRTHGSEGNPDEEEYPTRLFTGEKYATEKYILDQLSEQVGYGFPFYDEQANKLQERGEDPFDYTYFTIGAKLVKEGMVGTFPDSIIIVGGCQSARSHDLMESLIRRGADHVLGWDATIGTIDNDKAMTLLLEDFLVNNVTLYDAVAKINKDVMPDFEFPSILKLFNAI